MKRNMEPVCTIVRKTTLKNLVILISAFFLESVKICSTFNFYPVFSSLRAKSGTRRTVKGGSDELNIELGLAI